MKKLSILSILLLPSILWAQDFRNQPRNTKTAVTPEQFVKELLIPEENVKKAYEKIRSQGRPIKYSLVNQMHIRRQLAEKTFNQAGVYELSKAQIEKAILEMHEKSVFDKSVSRTLYANAKTGVKIVLTNFGTPDSLKAVFESISVGEGAHQNKNSLAYESYQKTLKLANDVAKKIQSLTGNPGSLEVVNRDAFSNNSKTTTIRDTTLTGKQVTVNHSKIDLYVQGSDKGSMSTTMAEKLQYVKEMSKNLLPTLSEVKKQSANFSINSTLNRFTSRASKMVKRGTTKRSKLDRAIKKGAKK